MSKTSASELSRVALEQFATVGFAGASLGSIAEAAGVAKSSVLYHYASKEALLAAAVQPTIAALRELVDSYPRDGVVEERVAFVGRFVDFLFEYRYAVNVFVNQGQPLRHIAAVDEANALVQRFGERVTDGLPNAADRIRFGVALGGAAYSIVAADNWSGDFTDTDEIRAALVDTVSALLVDRSTASVATF